jgi:hypothetical protein
MESIRSELPSISNILAKSISEIVEQFSLGAIDASSEKMQEIDEDFFHIIRFLHALLRASPAEIRELLSVIEQGRVVN